MNPKPYGVNELREMFLSFFESKGHLRLPSFSLIPQNDASLLLINSGMAPMKPYFTGEVEPPRHHPHRWKDTAGSHPAQPPWSGTPSSS